MKKLRTAAAIALACLSSQVIAEEQSDDQYKWVGFYGMHYDVNEDKPYDTGALGRGIGLGLEAGWKFTPNMALRAEFTRVALRSVDANPDEDGNLYGLDALYFLDNDYTYVFSGLKMLDLVESYPMLSGGVGRHWDLNENARFVTELAGYYDFGEGMKDWSLKIGFAFDFGEKGKSIPKSTTSNAPLDSDGDGVVDGKDRCPNTATGATVDVNGCAMAKDSDRDGVADTADKCPNTPTGDVVDADGCTRFGEKEISKTVRVLFSNNSAEIANPNDAQIVDLANFLKRYGKVDAMIEGHASAPGTDAYNMDLSKRRANAFKDVLVNQYGISSARLSTEGFGETQLLDSSNTAEAHRINRRIVVNISETIKVKLTK